MRNHLFEVSSKADVKYICWANLINDLFVFLKETFVHCSCKDWCFYFCNRGFIVKFYIEESLRCTKFNWNRLIIFYVHMIIEVIIFQFSSSYFMVNILILWIGQVSKRKIWIWITRCFRFSQKGMSVEHLYLRNFIMILRLH